MTAKRKAARKRGSISGRVSEALGPPLDGVDVTATGAVGTTAAKTTADGRYVIQPLAPGDYTVEVRTPPGFIESPPRKIVVPPGSDVTDVDFGLRPEPGAVSGPI